MRKLLPGSAIAMAAGMLKSLVTKDTPDEDTMNHGKIEC